MLNAKNKEKNFYDMCEVIGPPSRVMRWCCTVFKTGAITQYINTMFRNYNRVLTFYGIRRSESASRNKYDMESDSPKITKQRIVSPIIDWLDVDVWLYISIMHIAMVLHVLVVGAVQIIVVGLSFYLKSFIQKIFINLEIC